MQCVRRICETGYIAPPRSLGRYAPGVRLRRALRAFTQWSGMVRRAGGKAGQRPRGTRFFIGSASPDEHLKIRRFKSVEGETRQDLKMPGISPRRLPRALSCSDPAVYRIPVPPFSRSGSVALSHSSHAGISARCRSFAPSWAVCTNPPFSPTAAPVPVTIILSPTRKSTQKRHWQQPLVTGN